MPDRFIDIAGFVEITPVVNQLEVPAFYQQKTAKEILKKYGTQIMAWSPLAQGKSQFIDFYAPDVAEMFVNAGK